MACTCLCLPCTCVRRWLRGVHTAHSKLMQGAARHAAMCCPGKHWRWVTQCFTCIVLLLRTQQCAPAAPCSHALLRVGCLLQILRYQDGEQYRPHFDYFHDTVHVQVRPAVVVMARAEPDDGLQTPSGGRGYVFRGTAGVARQKIGRRLHPPASCTLGHTPCIKTAAFAAAAAE
jgi:hypothetical protein